MKKLFKTMLYNLKKLVFAVKNHVEFEKAGEAMIIHDFIQKKEATLKVKEKNGYITLYHFSPKKFQHFDHRFFRTGQGGSANEEHFFGGNVKSSLAWMRHMELKEGYLYTVKVPTKYANKDFVIDEFTYWYIEYTVPHKFENEIKIINIKKVKEEVK